MLLFLSLLGLVLSIILLTFNARSYKSAIYLGGFFFLVSLYGFIQYAVFYSGSVILISIMYINPAFLTYMIGPMLYWYIRSVLKDKPSLKKRDAWHVLPALIFLLSVLPYIFTPYSHKIQAAGQIAENAGFIGSYQASLLNPFISNAVIYLSRPLSILCYALFSGWMVVRFIIRKRGSSVFLRQKYMVPWLAVLLGFLLILAFSHLILLSEAFSYRDTKLFFTLNLLQVLSGAGIAGLLISPFFFPGILYGLPRYPGLVPEEKPPLQEVFLSNELVKRRLPNYESDYLELIRQRLDKCMVEIKPYLNQNCNLAFIAACTNIPAHHIAYYFREVKKQSFNDFRNELRVNHAKKLIREGKARGLTLEAIGLQSGFSTRNTFFTSFKKTEGISPSTYASRF